MDLTLTVPLTDKQLAGLKYIAGDEDLIVHLITDIQVKADNAMQRKKDAERAARQSAFDSLTDEQQAFFGAIVMTMPSATPDVQATVLDGAAKIAEALGVDTKAVRR